MAHGFGFWRLGSAAKALVVLGLGLAMLGAHYTRLESSKIAIPGLPAEIADIHAGAGLSASVDPTHSFRLVAFQEWGRFAALDSAERLTVLKLNRIDLAHARRRNLVVPDSLADELAYAPLPENVTALATTAKFIAVSRRVQAFGAYEYGRLVRWGPTSTGKATTPTDSGLFFTNWKSRTTVSTEDPSWILDWYVNFIAIKGVAFHQYELPGRPASHGCVRLLEEDAKWMYDWTEQWVPGRGAHVKDYGTPVLVFGDYEYNRTAPWAALVTGDPRATVSEWEMSAALAPSLETVQERAAPKSEAERWQAFIAGALQRGTLN